MEVYIPSNGNIHISKTFYVGQLNPGASRTLPVISRVADDANTGLTAANIHIHFDGFDSNGDKESDLITTWDVPIRVSGKPLFQITPLKTTYYKDNLDELVLEGALRASVKDLEATLTSNCITIMGSSRQYIGDVRANGGFNITYKVKLSLEGACSASLKLEYTDESGAAASSNLSFGLNIEGAGVDFKIMGVEYTPVSPGDKVSLKILMKNTGGAQANDPKIILADEPTGNLDQKTGRMMMEILTRLNREDKKTLVIITHDKQIADECDRVIRIQDGKTI